MNDRIHAMYVDKLEAKYGSRFTPPKLLIEMAAKGETFYGRFPPKKLAAV